MGGPISKGSSTLLNTSGASVNPATEDTVSQLVLTITNAIDSTAYDLNAAAFSEVTAITDDFTLDSVELNFSTAEAKTITITSVDGTIIWGGAVDTTAANQGYLSTAKNIALDFNQRSFKGGDNITVAVTQFGSAGTMDCILKTKTGSNSLLGTPKVKITDDADTVVSLDTIVESVPTTETFHHLGHEGNVFIHSNKHSVVSLGSLDELIKVPASPAGRQVHVRFNYTATDVPGDICLYRDVTVSADGTPEIINSNNDAVVKTTGVEIFEGPTITDIGNEWSCGLLSGQKNSAGSKEQVVPEYVLKAGVNYLIRYTNNNNSTIDLVTAIFFFDSGAT